MSPNLLSLLLARLNLDPPVLSASELRKHPEQSLEVLKTAGILQPATAATAFPCPDCGNLRRVQIEIDGGKKEHGYISCPQCSVSEIDLALLRRWAIDPVQLIATIFRSSGASVGVSPLVPGRLWRIGKATWCGKSRELLLSLCRRRDQDNTVLAQVTKRPKSVLFVPTESAAVDWSDVVPNAVVALESVASLLGATFAFDSGYVQTTLSVADSAAADPAKPKSKRRATRTANIDALKAVLIEHLRAARDHAVSTRDRTGEPQLLPCPTKEEFAKQAGVAPYDVTRCFQDEAGSDLSMLWDLAHDLDRILAYRSE